MSCPLPFSSAHSFRRLSDVHNCRRIGSPRVAGSSSASRSERRVGSSVILDLRPPPCRRIRSFSTEARSWRSSSPRYIVPVSYTHLRAHETDSYLVCRLLLEKKKKY